MCRSGCAAAAVSLGASSLSAEEEAKPDPKLYEGRFYTQLDEGKLQCEVCPRNCEIKPGESGHCETRLNQDGKLYSLTYGRPVAIHNDPIEKKPFFHVYPGSKALSLATVGCNMDCKFCQNWEISQKKPSEVPVSYIPPEDIARLAVHYQARTVAFTYTEPSISVEYVVDCSKEAKNAGLGSVVVSNGYINEEPQKELLSVLTAYKVDLKAFSQQFYGQQCGGKLKPVLESLKRISYSSVWYEIVVLVIPTLNDNMDEIKRMSEWIVTNLGNNVPLHFTRFHPQYQLQNLPPTAPKTLMEARKIAMGAGCNFVYAGNLPGTEGENTLCPSCKTVFLRRYGHMTTSDLPADGKCTKCKTLVPGIWH